MFVYQKIENKNDDIFPDFLIKMQQINFSVFIKTDLNFKFALKLLKFLNYREKQL